MSSVHKTLESLLVHVSTVKDLVTLLGIVEKDWAN